VLRGLLAEQVIEGRPLWLSQALGERPDGPRERGLWDDAASAIANFRLDNDIVDQRTPLAMAPEGDEPRRAWDQARASLARAQRQLGHEPAAREKAPELGIG
jgi:hypothetical protein